MSVSVGFGRGVSFTVSRISVEYIAHISMPLSGQTFLDEIDSCVGGYSAFSTINVKCWWWFLLYIKNKQIRLRYMTLAKCASVLLLLKMYNTPPIT